MPRGRPRHPARTLVEKLLAAGLSDRAVQRTLAERQIAISRPTIAAIRSGRRPAPVASLLNPGERKLRSPVRCPGPCRGWIVISPCRTCGAVVPE